MTDKEMLLYLIQKLELKETKTKNLNYDEYKIEDNKIILGEGEGCDGLYITFTFDGQNNLIKHGAWE